MKKLLLIHAILATGLIQSCTMVKVRSSEKRNPIPQSVVVDQELKITSWGAIQVNKAHFYPSSFQLKWGGTVSYIDPVEIPDGEKADYIFLTHAHPDHFSLTTIEKIVKPETVFICPKGVSAKLEKKGYKVREVRPGITIGFNGIQCEAVAAYNTKNVFLWIKAHPKSKGNVGYVLDFGRTRIYHAGDTDLIPEMDGIASIAVAMVPVGGDNLTMDVEEAARMVNQIKPDRVIPMHYELKNSEDLKKFGALVGKEIDLLLLE
ncbi:MBL fold metallo-hydrolase [Flavobacteriaceae bacterium 3-367]|uniref:MBL fold metallo-hydrolase n=1 Tax=Eudoraea algarum TaxID=3417568 RepID=UPI00326883B5